MQVLNRNSHQYKLVFSLFVLYFNVACKPASNLDDIKGIQASIRFPIVGLTGEVNYNTDSIQVYYYKDLVTLRTSYTFIGLKDDGTTEETNRFRYFIFGDGQKYGQLFENLDDTSRQSIQLPVDSVLRTSMYHVNLGQIKDSFDLVRSSTQDQIYTDVYSVRYHEPSMFDSIRCWYDPNLAKSKYVLDSFFNVRHNGHLSRLQIEFNSFRDEQYKRDVQRHTIDYRLMELLTIDDKVIKFIKSYKSKDATE
ncbi:MAG: hypothetical protein DI535_07990 [Citrobacter freundii]|nr:MAG: hypothetical protein DI535_07990 [Citrobacter freundii]